MKEAPCQMREHGGGRGAFVIVKLSARFSRGGHWMCTVGITLIFWSCTLDRFTPWEDACISPHWGDFLLSHPSQERAYCLPRSSTQKLFILDVSLFSLTAFYIQYMSKSDQFYLQNISDPPTQLHFHPNSCHLFPSVSPRPPPISSPCCSLDNNFNT